MSYSVVFGAVGAAVGYYVGGPTGAQYGWAIGSTIGAVAQPGEKIEGPRLQDLRLTGSEYGAPIPWCQGNPRVAGGVWWSSEKREISATEGGKGGGPEVTSFTYEVDVLIGVTDNEITGIRRVWSNGKLVFSADADADENTLRASVEDAPWRGITVYTGASNQMPDPIYEAAVGVDDACAYRGRGTVMIEGLQLGGSGFMPNLTFEVVVDGTSDEQATVRLQTKFEGADSSDISSFDIGAGVLVGAPYASVADGYFLHEGTALPIDRSGTLTWTDQSLAAPASGPFTVEALISITSARNVNYDPVLKYSKDASDVSTQFVIGATGSDTRLVFRQDAVAFTGTTMLTDVGQSLHVAMVSNGTSETRIYAGSALVYTHVQPITSSSPNPGSLQIGGAADSVPEAFSHIVREVRVSAAELYTGATYTAPTTFDDPINTQLVSVSNPSLQTVVERLMETIGLTSAEFDATALSAITRPVRGLAVGQVSAARATLEVLQAAFFFESSLSDKLRFRPRSVTAVDTIAYDDLAAGNDGPSGEPLAITFGGDLEVPSQFALTYVNKSADDQNATEYSDRMISGQASTSVAALPIGLLPSEAKGIVDAIMADTLMSVASTSIRLPMVYAELEPGDVVLATDSAGTTLRVRLVQRTDALGVLAFLAVADDSSALISAGITDDDYDDQTTVTLGGETVMVVMDIPLLRDADDAPGWYVAARGTAEAWPGAVIRKSPDDVDFTTAAEVNESAVLGVCLTTLAAFSGGWVFDETNTLSVDVDHGQLESATRDAILNDRTVNVMLVGSELIQFRTATMTGSGLYTLSGLLRGRSGTEWAIDTHESGERCVLIRAQGIRRVTTQFSEVGALRYVKGVTRGRPQDTAPSQQFTNTAISNKPLAVVDLRKIVTATGGVEASWIRRTRFSTKFMGTAGAVVPLAEPSEQYQVDVYGADTDSALISTTIVTEPRISAESSGSSASGITSATVAKTYSEGVAFPYEYDGHFFGINIEGAGSKTLIKMNDEGAVVDSSFVIGDDNMVSSVVYVGSDCYAIGHFLYPNGVYQFTRIVKLSLDDLSVLAAYYNLSTPGDAAALVWDGSNLWSTGPSSGKLRKHDPSDLSVIDDFDVGAGAWGLAHAGAEIFIVAMSTAGKVLAFEAAGGTETVVWETALGPNEFPLEVLLTNGNVFTGGGGKTIVLDQADGSTVATHTDGQPYYLPNTGAIGLTLFEGLVYYKVDAYSPFKRLNAASGALDSTAQLPVTTLVGELNGNLLGVLSPTGSFLNYQSYELTLGGSDGPEGSLAGLRLVVRQIGQNSILGYPAEITL